MNEAEKLLNSLSTDDISLQLANPETEPHIVVGEDRFITVPEELRRIAVQFDHDVETVTFDCPRYWDGLDMSDLSIYINYMRKDKYVGCYKATDITVDAVNSSIMHFNWKISRNVSEIMGELKFLVCIKKGDSEGYEVNHWNSELNNEMYVSEGLELGSDYFDAYPDIITQWEDEVDAVKQILLDARDSGELDGATFTPSVDADGNLSWTNDKGRTNPATVNVKGYSPRVIVKEITGGKQLVITDYNGSQTVDILDGKDGKDGADGTNGTNGENGYSPRIVVREVTGGHQLVITDYTGSQTVDVLNGTNGKDGAAGKDGTNGTNGTDGQDGYSPRVLVRTVDGGHQLVITDYSGSQTVDVMDGADGQDGAAGTNGTDGVSPTVTVTNITGGHRVTITDKDGTKTFDVKDGTNTSETGSDGVSPTVSVVEITGGHRVTITDVDGAKAFDVMDGETGATGATGENGYSPRILVREVDGGHQLVITDYSGSQTVDVMDGAAGKDGTNGTNGQDGEDGYSPTVATEAVTGGTKVTITDKTGAKVFTVLNGTNGQDGTDGTNGIDGVSPTVAVTDISGGHRVTITDKDGAKSFDVMDGEGGGTDGTPVYVGEVEPTSGPVLWFDTSARS